MKRGNEPDTPIPRRACPDERTTSCPLQCSGRDVRFMTHTLLDYKARKVPLVSTGRGRDRAASIDPSHLIANKRSPSLPRVFSPSLCELCTVTDAKSRKGYSASMRGKSASSGCVCAPAGS